MTRFRKPLTVGLCLLLLVLSAAVSNATTVLVQLIGSPRSLAPNLTEAVMKRQVLLIESSVLNELFDHGFILGSFPPLVSTDPNLPSPSVATLGRQIIAAKAGGARWLICVDVRLDPPPRTGAPALVAAEYSLYNLADGVGRLIKVERLPLDSQNLGAAIGRQVSQYL